MASLPDPIVVPGSTGLDELLAKNWLLTNRLGAYASASAAGANTWRYHALLVGATLPPVGRLVALSCLLDQFTLAEGSGEKTYDLATFEFDHLILPNAHDNLVEFRLDLCAQYEYRCGESRLLKQILLAEAANAVAVRYRLLSGPAGRLRIRPFLSLRGYHHLRKTDQPQQMMFQLREGNVIVEDRLQASHSLLMNVCRTGESRPSAPARAAFTGEGQWWYRFRYRGDIARGQDGFEDLYSPGFYDVPLTADRPVQLTACLDEPVEVDFEASLEQKRSRMGSLVESVGETADDLTRRLALATDAFLVDRRWPNPKTRRTILAGYYWFADWGRDAMIALPGLLLETKRFDEALEVLRTFTAAMQNGMIPNCFDDYALCAHYNSIDASLWFIIAADRYVRASGNERAWQDELAGPVERILQAYHDGTSFDIHADADGMLYGGSEKTQLTWMDAKIGSEIITPRHGKAVEINALWLAALRIAGRRTADSRQAAAWADLAGRVATTFPAMFWNPAEGCLFDRVVGDWKDGTIRPNQVIALSLPHCPLSRQQQESVLNVVERDLLTPLGLRTLSPRDSRYRGRYGASIESRDRAYHQGTVWPWLMGPFIEAYLRVHGFSEPARRQARQWLSAFEPHLLNEHGLGSISEVFDGDAPHHGAGTIAQAWSVSEILRAKRLADGPPPQD